MSAAQRSQHDPRQPPRHLVLVGMMGTGKSTVGRLVAQRLGRRLVDSDAVIEERTGRTVREIFVADGEPAFRALESQVLAEALADPEPTVIAAAGGVVLHPANRAALRAADVRVVWLTARPEVLAQRIARASGTHRPLLDDDPDAMLQAMWTHRAPLYREVADAVVSVDQRSVAEVVEAVLR